MTQRDPSVGDLVARREMEERFAHGWAVRDPRAKDLLDELAAAAPVDPDALELLLVLLERHGVARPALHALLFDGHDVDDAEQATLAAVALKVGQFDGRARFTTWLHTVAGNEARMLLRARRRRPAEPVAEPEPAPFLARCSTLVANRDLVERVMAELPSAAREVLELREIRGMPYDEIADHLDLPVGTVRSRLSRARVQLAQQLVEQGAVVG